MSSFILSPVAKEDLWAIWGYIALENHNVQAADRLWADILTACEKLGRRPELGHVRRDLTLNRDVLFYCVRDHYLVLYRSETKPLEIIRVFHGARDIGGELSSGE